MRTVTELSVFALSLVTALMCLAISGDSEGGGEVRHIYIHIFILEICIFKRLQRNKRKFSLLIFDFLVVAASDFT